MIWIDNGLYTGRIHTIGVKEGATPSDDALLDVKLSPPGSGKPGTHREQLFAAG